MAHEIRINYPADGATLYALARRLSDVKVWDAGSAAWDTWADADLDDYDVPLSDRGGHLYTATFPAAIATGTELALQIRLQDGASPSLADDMIVSATVAIWDGTRLVDPGSGNLATMHTRLQNLVGASSVTDATISDAATDIDWYRGDTAAIEFDSSRVLTGGSLTFTVRLPTGLSAEESDDPTIQKTSAAAQIVLTDAAAGQFSVYLTAADTEDLCETGVPAHYQYDVQFTDADGYIRTIYRGMLTVYPDVTF